MSRACILPTRFVPWEDIQAARDYNLDTLYWMVRNLGKDHEHSLATANSVAAYLRLLAQFKQALLLD